MPDPVEARPDGTVAAIGRNGLICLVTPIGGDEGLSVETALDPDDGLPGNSRSLWGSSAPLASKKRRSPAAVWSAKVSVELTTAAGLRRTSSGKSRVEPPSHLSER